MGGKWQMNHHERVMLNICIKDFNPFAFFFEFPEIHAQNPYFNVSTKNGFWAKF